MIKNIILDFGAVLIPIDESKTWQAFKSLGADVILQDQTEIFYSYETGKISSKEFLAKIQPFFFRKIFLPDLAQAWNALLSPLPEDNIQLLKRLRKDYRLFLLSNTNDLHIKAIKETAGPFLYNQFIKQFEKVYFSYEVGLRKPDKAIFEKVLSDNDLKAEETFYVDDGKQHIKTAREMGIHTWHLEPDVDHISDLDKVLSEHHSLT